MFEAMGHRLGRLLGRRRALEQAARRRWVVAAASEETTPPSCFLPDDLDRVSALQEETTPALEHRRVHGGRVVHEPSVAYRLDGCDLIAGHLYADGCHLSLTPRPQPWLRTPGALPRQREPRSLVSTWAASRYFGHFVTDGLPLALLARAHAAPVRIAEPETAHQQGYRRHTDTEAEPVPAARFDQLLVFEDHAQNDDKRARYDLLHRRIAADLPPTLARGVYLRRGDGVGRRLVNEPEVEACLLQRGFTVVDPSRQPLADIVAALAGAPVAVGVEGSQLAHAVYTIARGGAIVALTPADRFNNVLKDYADATGLRYGFTVCDAADGGCRADIGRLGRLLDRLDGAG